MTSSTSSFPAAALLFWWPAVALDPAPWRMPHPVRALYVFLQMTQNTLLAVVIVNAQTVLYPHYATVQRALGPTPLADQRMAGAFMWVAGDLLFLTATMAILVGWSRAEDGTRRARTEGGGGGGRDRIREGRLGRPPRARARRRPERRARSRRSAGAAPRGKRGRRPGRRCHRSRRPRRLHRRRRPTRAMERERRDGQRARWLHDQPRPFRREPDAGRDLRLMTVTIPSRYARRWARSGRQVPGSACRRRSSAQRQRPTNGRSIRLPTIARIGRELGLDADHPNVQAQALIAVATPLASPPPPTGTSTRPVVGRSWTISRPIVPWPAMIRPSSNGRMIARPRSAAIDSARAWRSSDADRRSRSPRHRRPRDRA